MRVKLAALAVGAVFGVTLSWSGMSSPEVLRDALLVRDPYLYLMFASAVATAFAGLRLLRARRPRALLTAKPTAWKPERPRRAHVVGSVIFGAGWAVADACPGPIATQLGQGVGWSVFTLTGVIAGIALYLRRQRAVPVPAAAMPARPPARAPAEAVR